MPGTARRVFALLLGLTVGPGLPRLLRADEAPAQWNVVALSDSTLSPAVIQTPAVVDPIRRRVLVIGTGGVLGGVWAMSLDGPPRWTRVGAAGQPFKAISHCMAIFDTPGDRMLVMGGTRDGGYFTDVWQLSFAGTPTWSKLTTVGPAPSQRDYSSAIFDPVRRRMIIFSGAVGTPANDVWALSLDGTPQWQQILPGGTPPSARTGHSAVYDSRRDRMLIFGGYRALSVFPYAELFNDVWQLPLADGSSWDSLTVSGTHPLPRETAPAVYDSLRDRVEFYGGYRNISPGGYLADHWWLTLAGSPAWVSADAPGGPGELASHAAAIDPEYSRTFVFGGASTLNTYRDAWTVPTEAPRTWQKISPVVPPGHPVGTYSPSVFLDRRHLIVALGHQTYYDYLANTLWSVDLSDGSWELLRADANQQPACVDTAGRRLVGFTPTYSFPVEHTALLWQIPLDGTAPWTSQGITGTTPEFRWFPDYIADPLRHRVLMYGGTTYPIPGHASIPRHEVWAFSFDTEQWSLVAPEMASFGPGHAVFDTYRDRLVFIPGAGGSVYGLSLDGSTVWQPLGWSVGKTPQDPYGAFPPLSSAMFHVDEGRDRVITSTWGDSLWVLPLGAPGDWTCLGGTGQAPNGEAWLAAFDPVLDRGYSFGGSCTSNGVWEATFDVTVPTQLALVRMWATSEAVELEWSGAASVVSARVERRDPGGEWITLGEVVADGTRTWRWRDASVVAGRRYAYRLTWSEPEGSRVTAETWVEVPRAQTLAFSGVSPNPSAGAAIAEFSLAATSDVEIEIFDPAGRRIAARRLAAVPAGLHRVPLAELASAAPGLHLVRLRVGAATFTRRVATVR